MIAACGASQAGVRANLPLDTNSDGIVDPDDRCPDSPEDLNGRQGEGGCPDCNLDVEWVACSYVKGIGNCPEDTAEDHDGDGVLNETDLCPEISEDDDGLEDQDGWPDLVLRRPRMWYQG